MICPHCGHPTEERNPSGYCDHLQYPDACYECIKIAKKKVEPKKEEPPHPKNYIDILSEECRALAECLTTRLGLNQEQSDALRQFVTDTAIKSWRNGRLSAR